MEHNNYHVPGPSSGRGGPVAAKGFYAGNESLPVPLAEVKQVRRRAAVVGFIAGVTTSIIIIGLLALFAIPMSRPSKERGRDARRAEAEQMLGSMKSQVRATYARTGDTSGIQTLTGAVPPTGNGCNVAEAELEGKYFTILDKVEVTDEDFTITAVSVNGKDGKCKLTSTWSGGSGTFTWTDE